MSETTPTTPPTSPAPTPTPTPTPTPAPDSGTPITIKGVITQMSRSGSDGIDVVFRIDLEPIRADAGTVVIDGSATGNTTYLRDGQTVTIDAVKTGDSIYAQRIVIDAKP